MPAIARTIVIICSLVAASGCAFYRAVSFESDDKTSFKREDSKATLQVYARSNPDHCVKGPPKLAESIDTAALPGVAGAAISVLLNIAESEISSYLTKKQKEFTASYNAAVNVLGYYSRGEPIDLFAERFLEHQKPPPVPLPAYSQASFNCLRLVRTVKEGDAFEWTASLRPNPSGTALMLQTEALSLFRAAARTDRTTRKVDISIEVKIDVTTLNEKGETVTTTVADKTLAHPGVRTPGEAGVVLPASVKPASSWFPAIPRSQKETERCDALQGVAPKCIGVSSTTVAVLVTEVGTGGEGFGDLAKQIDDNKKTLNDAISGAVKDALTPKATGVSSKPAGSSK